MSQKPKQLFYRVSDVAELLDISERTIRRYIDDGKIGHPRL